MFTFYSGAILILWCIFFILYYYLFLYTLNKHLYLSKKLFDFMTSQLIRIIDILSYLNSTYNIKYERIPIRVIFKKKKKKYSSKFSQVRVCITDISKRASCCDTCRPFQDLGSIPSFVQVSQLWSNHRRVDTSRTIIETKRIST